MVSCKICGYRHDKTIQQHVKFKHKMSVSEYYEKYPGTCVYSKEYTDFLRKRIVEADGDWWHANPEFMRERKITKLHSIQKKMIRLDKAKNIYLKNHEWKLLRFWERDIYNNTELCLHKIKEALNG